VRGKGIVGSRPSGRSLSGNAIVARMARFGEGALRSLGDSSSAGLVTLSMIGAALGARWALGADYCFDQISQESAST
jgi:hypothetical protein